MAANRSRFFARFGRSLPVALTLGRLLLAFLLIGSSLAPVSAASTTGQRVSAALAQATGEYVPAEVLIGWQAGTAGATGWPPQTGAAQALGTAEYRSAVQTISTRTGLTVLEAHLSAAAARLAVPAGQEQAEIARLVKLPGVRYAELNHIAHAALVPSDPLYSQQWNLARVNAPAAWDLHEGSASVIVAVVDSGIDSGHPEFPPSRRILPGSGAHNFVAGNDYPIDDFGHGTHVAGIIAAGIDDGIGLVGMAPGVRILPLKALDSQGLGSYFNIAAAIRWAADWSINYPQPGDPNARVRVINLSLGGYAEGQMLQDAVAYATSHGILVVAAAGNCAQGCWDGSRYLYNPYFYPAAYAGVLAVGATDRGDNWADYSGHQPYVSISAPGGIAGEQILSALPYAKAPSGYGYNYGTSMATPLVSGAAALAWSLWPGAAPAEISATLTSAADKVPLNAVVCAYDNIALQHSPCFGYGRLNALRVARSAYPPSLRPALTRPVFLFDPDEPVSQRTYSVPLLNPSEREVSWHTSVISGAQWLSTVPNEQDGPVPSSYSAPGTLYLTAQPRQLKPGTYTGVVQVTSVFPYELGLTFNITATLIISDSLYHVYAPVLAR